ncbi:MAG: 50S ribosomal protein L15 [Myxococcales bacterium]|nr:50S ribosomal protein L15 [Myxococcales bacterium]
MGTTLHTLTPPEGARKKKKRLGRGIGSHRGKTSGHGMKGQLYRHTAMPVSFEGGQLPIHRRVPKRGFVNIHRVEVHGINVGALSGFEAGTEITPELLLERGLVPKKATVIKLLGDGEVSAALTIKLHRASASAQAKIEAAGGSLQLLGQGQEQVEGDAG